MYQYKEIYTIDFTNVQYYLEMHSVIRQALDWPDYYGCNWDAFWDCLTNMIGRPIHIEIMGLETVDKKFDGVAKKMMEIFKDLKHYQDDEFADEITIDILNGAVKTNIE